MSRPEYIERDVQLALNGLCEERFDIVLNERCENPNAGERERKRMEERLDSKYYLSTGQYEDSNKGFRGNARNLLISLPLFLAGEQ